MTKLNHIQKKKMLSNFQNQKINGLTLELHLHIYISIKKRKKERRGQECERREEKKIKKLKGCFYFLIKIVFFSIFINTALFLIHIHKNIT